MSLLSEIKEKNKKKNRNNTRIIIRNQKLMNIVRAILFLTLIIADLVYIIKENIIGISYFTHIVLLVSLILESLIFLSLAVLKFNTENKILKIISTAIFAIPVIAYVPMMGYGDGFSIILFITRLILVLGLLYIATKEKTQSRGKLFVIRQISYLLMASIIFVIAFILLITSQSRRVLYSYDDELDGYVVKNILNGSSDVVFKDGTIKISDNSLKNAGKVITIPETVNEVSNNAFLNSNVEEVYLNSSNITIVDALNNSNVKKVYINNPDLVIKDLSKASRRSNFKFYLSKDAIDAYREKNRRYDYLFSPICDEGEYFVAYNNTSLPIEYYKLDDYVNSPKVTTTEKKRFSNWIYAFSNESASDIKFPLKVTDNIELFALWDVVYTINIDYDNATVVNQDDYWDDMPKSIDVTIRDGNIILPILEKPGYRFEGWYKTDDYSFFDDNIISTSIIDDMDIRARFSKIYILDYELNGGELSDEEMYAEYVDGDIITPATPTRFGYEFAGWYDNKEFEGYAINKVYNLKTKLYAKWNLIAPTIKLSNDISKVYDGDASTISVDVSHPLMESSDYNLSIKWYRNDDNKAISTKNSYRIIDAESNKYYCHITISHLGNTYELDTDYINVNIEKAEYDMSDILANFAGKKFEYEFNGHDQKPQIESLPLGIDMISVFAKYSYEGNFLNVGDNGKIIVNFETESPNYNAPDKIEASVLIKQKKLTINWDSLVHVYDGTNWKPQATLIGEVEGYPVSLEFLNSFQSINVGNYEINIGVSDVENYILDDETVEYEIVQADYTNEEFDVINDSFEYDGNNHIVELDLPAGLSIDLEKSTFAKNVNDNTVTVYFKLDSGFDNYKAPEPRIYDIEIKPLAVSYNVITSSFEYNGQAQKPEVALAGILASDDVNAIVTNDNTINADTYKLNVILDGADSNNYTLVDNGNYYVITKANYDLSNITYQNEFVYNGEIILPTPSNLPTGLEFDSINSIGLKDACVDGKITFKFINTSNNYNNASELEGVITIKPKAVAASVVVNEFTYNGLLQTPEISLSGVISGDDLNANATNTDSINVNNYSAIVELNGQSKNNYVIDLENSNLEYKIVKADFDYKYEFDADTYVTYDGTEHEPSRDISGGKTKYYNNKEIKFEFSKKPINAGDYLITITFSIDDNYIIKTLDCNLHIEKRELELEFESLKFEHQDTAIIPTVTNIINIVDGDNVNVTVYNDETSTGTHLLNIQLSGTSSNNYVISTKYYIEIDEEVRELLDTDYTITPYEGVYDGNEHTVLVELDPSIQSEIKYVVDRVAKNVGTYTVNISFESLINGVIISTRKQSTIKINPKPVTVSFIDTDLVYNGSVQIPEYTINGVIGNDIVNVIIDEAFEPIDAGTYNNVNASLDNNNYVISGSNTLSFEIAKCEVDLVWDNLNLTYTGSLLKPEASVYLGDERLFIDVNVQAETNINVGTYQATATIDSVNYVILNDNIINYNIVPKPIKIEWGTLIFTYNGKVQLPKPTVSVDNCNVIVESNMESKLPNTYQATASLDNPNYEILGSNIQEYTINKGVISEDDIPEIASITEVVYDGNSHIPSIDSMPKVASDGNQILYKATGKVDAGSWYVDIEFYVEGNNYNSFIVSYPIIISERPLNITLTNTSLKYNNSILNPTISCSNVVSGDDINLVINNNSISVGKYILDSSNIEIVGDKASNYKIEGEYVYNIIKGDLDLSSVSFTNTEITYDGNSHLPSAVLPDNVLIDLENSIGVTNVADTKATIKFVLSGSKANNYETPADIIVNMKVNPKLLQINWTKTMFGYDGSIHMPSYELNGLVNSDLANIIFDNAGATNRGDYSITALSVDNNNYYIEEEVIEYTILDGEYDMSGVEISDITRTYDGKSHKELVVDPNMLPDGVTATVTYEENDSVIYVGRHKATIKFSGDETNYVPIDDMYAYIIINPKPITVTWSNTTLTYNGYKQAPTATISSGVISGDVVEIGVTGSQKNAGTYQAEANLSNDNYVASIESQSASFTINPKPIDVAIKIGTTNGPNFTFTYDGKIHNNITVEIDQDDLCSSDSIFDITVNDNIAKLVGTYAYTLVSGNSNYVPSTTNGTVKINELYIGWSGSEPTVHNGTATSLPYMTALINGAEVRLDTLGTAEYPLTYHYYRGQWSGGEITGEMESGTYYMDCSCDYDGINIYYYRQKVSYINPVIKWSADGNYQSSLFEIKGNYKNASNTFTYNGNSYTFASPLKLESDTENSYISFTLDSSKKLVLFMTGGTTIKINGQTKSYTSGEVYEIELEAGTYTITKGSGSTVVYAIFLE